MKNCFEASSYMNHTTNTPRLVSVQTTTGVQFPWRVVAWFRWRLLHPTLPPCAAPSTIARVHAISRAYTFPAGTRRDATVDWCGHRDVIRGVWNSRFLVIVRFGASILMRIY